MGKMNRVGRRTEKRGGKKKKKKKEERIEDKLSLSSTWLLYLRKSDKDDHEGPQGVVRRGVRWGFAHAANPRSSCPSGGCTGSPRRSPIVW